MGTEAGRADSLDVLPRPAPPCPPLPHAASRGQRTVLCSPLPPPPTHTHAQAHAHAHAHAHAPPQCAQASEDKIVWKACVALLGDLASSVAGVGVLFAQARRRLSLRMCGWVGGLLVALSLWLWVGVCVCVGGGGGEQDGVCGPR